MQLFTAIDDAVAIVRTSKGVHKQTKVYQRGDRVFVPHAGGFVRITARFDSSYGTSHPDIKVIEIEALGVVEKGTELRFASPLKAVA